MIGQSRLSRLKDNKLSSYNFFDIHWQLPKFGTEIWIKMAAFFTYNDMQFISSYLTRG